jgi:c-di-GMP-binding flagellar brake protein YcgR
MQEYLKELADLNTHVDIFRDGVCLAAQRRLLYQPDEDEVLVGLADEEIGDGEINISFFSKGSVYEFRTTIRGVDEKNGRERMLRLEVPRRIVKADRRKGAYRATPQEGRPVNVRLTLADSETISTTAIDMSITGISFPLPRPIDFLSAGEQYPMDLGLPDGSKLKVKGEIRNRRAFAGVSRFGAQFVDLSDDDRIAISRYVRQCEIDRRKAHDSANDPGRPSICVIAPWEKIGRYGLLKQHCFLRRIDPKGAIQKLADNKPRLLIIDCDSLERGLLVNTIRKHSILCELPILVVGEPEKYSTGDMYTTSVSSQVSDQVLTNLVEQITSATSRGKEIRRTWEKTAGEGRFVLIFDRTDSFGSGCTHQLKSRQFKVTVVDSTADLIDEINRRCPDVLFIDEKSDKLTAVQMLTLFKSNPVLDSVPKILMTRERQSGKELKKQGLITSYVEKPLHPATVMNEINTVLLGRIVKAVESAGTGEARVPGP